MKKENNTSIGYKILPLVATLNTTCNFSEYFQAEAPSPASTNYVCSIGTSAKGGTYKEMKNFVFSFAEKSWSLTGENMKDLISYGQSIEPGLSVVVRAYANSPKGITEDFAKRRIESTMLFLSRGNEFLDMVPEVVYDTEGSIQRRVELIPQNSRVHSYLDKKIERMDMVLIEQSAAMKEDGLWAAIQNYNFANVPVSIITKLNPDCGKDLQDISAIGESVVPEGLSQYLARKGQGNVLLVTAHAPESLDNILYDAKTGYRVEVLSPQILKNDGLADAGMDTASRR